MATVTKIIGPISAYAIAVANGYTGTEAEFAEEIANASTNAQTAQDAANHCDEVLESIPQDYSTMSAAVTGMTNAGRDNAYPGYNFLAESVSGYWYTKSISSGNPADAEMHDAPSSAPNLKGVSISVTPGDVFEISAGVTGPGSYCTLWTVIDSNRVSIARAGTDFTDSRNTPVKLTIPTGGAQLLINYDPVAYPGSYVVRMNGVAKIMDIEGDNTYPGHNYLAEGTSGYWYTTSPSSPSATDAVPRDAPTSYPNAKCVSIPCAAGDVFEIAIGTSTSSARNPWAVIDSSRMPIARSGSSGSPIDYTANPIVLIIPTGGVQLLINYDPVAYPGSYVVRAKRQYNVVGPSFGVPMSSSINGNAAATDNITNGKLFVANDKLYKATTAIDAHTSGAGNIVPGTNCTETTIVEQLNELASTSNISISNHTLNIP